MQQNSNVIKNKMNSNQIEIFVNRKDHCINDTKNKSKWNK